MKLILGFAVPTARQNPKLVFLQGCLAKKILIRRITDFGHFLWNSLRNYGDDFLHIKKVAFLGRSHLISLYENHIKLALQLYLNRLETYLKRRLREYTQCPK